MREIAVEMLSSTDMTVTMVYLTVSIVTVAMLTLILRGGDL